MKNLAEILKGLKGLLSWPHYVLALLVAFMSACFGDVKGWDQVMYLLCIAITCFAMAVLAHHLWLSSRPVRVRQRHLPRKRSARGGRGRRSIPPRDRQRTDSA